MKWTTFLALFSIPVLLSLLPIHSRNHMHELPKSIVEKDKVDQNPTLGQSELVESQHSINWKPILGNHSSEGKKYYDSLSVVDVTPSNDTTYNTATIMTVYNKPRLMKVDGQI